MHTCVTYAYNINMWMFQAAQESTSEPVSDTFFAMDTTMDFRIYGDKSLLQDAQNVITDLEKKVSVNKILTVRFIKSMKMVPEF
mgnify:CR=1 FL=1